MLRLAPIHDVGWRHPYYRCKTVLPGPDFCFWLYSEENINKTRDPFTMFVLRSCLQLGESIAVFFVVVNGMLS